MVSAYTWQVKISKTLIMIVLFFFLEVLYLRGVYITLILHNKIKEEKMSDLLKYKLVGDGPKKVIILHDWSVSCEGDYEYALPFFDLNQLTMAFVDVRG